jgi:hypothetical protein
VKKRCVLKKGQFVALPHGRGSDTCAGVGAMREPVV